MKTKTLVKYLKNKIKEYREKHRKVLISGETRAWFAGKLEAYEDVLYQIEKPYLDEFEEEWDKNLAK